MDIEQLYQDFSVDYKTEGHKHCRPGWVNTECPWCEGNPGYHLGYHISDDHYYCWRCGWHPVAPTIALLLHIKEREARIIIRQYGLLIAPPQRQLTERSKKEHCLPSNVEPLTQRHKKYLEDRGYDPDFLEREWSLVGTGPVSLLDNLNYKFRIVIPFIWNEAEISFDSRDITNHSPYKYMACPDDREIIPRKSVLYGKQQYWTDTAICVEGYTDVWRLGRHAVATGGIEYKQEQVHLLAKSFRRVAVVFDGPSETSAETQAALQADKLVADLKFRKVDAFRIPILGDPGGMPQSEADYLIKQIIK